MIPSPLLFDRMIRELVRRRDEEVAELAQARGRAPARRERPVKRASGGLRPTGRRPGMRGKRRWGAT